MISTMNRFRGCPWGKQTQKLAKEIEAMEKEIAELEKMTVLPAGVSLDALDAAAEAVVTAKNRIEKIRVKLPVYEEKLRPLIAADVHAYIEMLFSDYQRDQAAAGKARQAAEAAEKAAKEAKTKADNALARTGSQLFVISNLRKQLAEIEKEPAPVSIAPPTESVDLRRAGVVR